MRDEVFNIKTLLEIIFNATNISGNKFADWHLHKNPAVIVRWKNGQAIPSADDIKILAEFASKNSIDSFKVSMRNEIKDLIMGSSLSNELKDVICKKEDFKEFLLEAITTSLMEIDYEKKLISEILSNLACIDSRLHHLQNYEFFDGETLHINPQQVEAFRKNTNSLTFRLECKHQIDGIEKEAGLNSEFVKSFYDELIEIPLKYEAFIDFLTGTANTATDNMETISCYIEITKSSMDILCNNSNIAHIKGLFALDSLGIRKNANSRLKNLTCLELKKIVNAEDLAEHYSAYISAYEKLVDEKISLVNKLKEVNQ